MITKQDITDGQLISQSNDPNAIRYKAIFEKDNLYIYRFVRKGRGYRGNYYPCDGWILAWTDCSDLTEVPPSFVPLDDAAVW
jgi:hypothetical protein